MRIAISSTNESVFQRLKTVLWCFNEQDWLYFAPTPSINPHPHSHPPFLNKQGKSEEFESCDRPIVGKRPIWVKIGDVLSRVTLKFDGWPWKTIGHLSFAVSSFVQHFIAIGEFKLELQSGNAQFGSNSTIFISDKRSKILKKRTLKILKILAQFIHGKLWRTEWQISGLNSQIITPQIMACRLIGAKPLSEPRLEYC